MGELGATCSLVMSEENSNDEVLATELIEGGSELAGAAVGAAVGFIAGPMGALGGAAAGVVVSRSLKRVGSEIRKRVMGPREEIRVGAAAAFAGEAITALLGAGLLPRDDGFFEANGKNERSKGDELLEGVLLKARDSYEEKKIAHLGVLYANIAFSKISASQANQLITLAGQLTYRQLVLLAISVSDEQKAKLEQKTYRENMNESADRLGQEGISILTDAYDLYHRGLLATGNGHAWISMGDIAPGLLIPNGIGATLTAMMNLPAIPYEDRREILERLGASKSSSSGLS